VCSKHCFKPTLLKHPKSSYWLKTCGIRPRISSQEACSGSSSSSFVDCGHQILSPPLTRTLTLSQVSKMGSHLFTSRSGLNLGIRVRKKQQHIFTCVFTQGNNSLIHTIWQSQELSSQTVKKIEQMSNLSIVPGPVPGLFLSKSCCLEWKLNWSCQWVQPDIFLKAP
jgi:hypothetical protein